MSNLVERLRDPRGFDYGDFYELCREAADRIEQLTSDYGRMLDKNNECAAIAIRLQDRIEALEKEIDAWRKNYKEMVLLNSAERD